MSSVGPTLPPLTRPRRARASRLRCANLELRPSGQLVLAHGRPVLLTTREFQLLLALAERRNLIVPRPELYELIWRRQMTRRDRCVDVFVRRLRCKLDQAAPGWRYIHTHTGVGYRFAPERQPPIQPPVQPPVRTL
jgi:DNA-binding response OmpR family regulator